MIHTRISIIVRMASGLTDLTAREVIAGLLKILRGFGINTMTNIWLDRELLLA